MRWRRWESSPPPSDRERWACWCGYLRTWTGKKPQVCIEPRIECLNFAWRVLFGERRSGRSRVLFGEMRSGRPGRPGAPLAPTPFAEMRGEFIPTLWPNG